MPVSIWTAYTVYMLTLIWDYVKAIKKFWSDILGNINHRYLNAFFTSFNSQECHSNMHFKIQELLHLIPSHACRWAMINRVFLYSQLQRRVLPCQIVLNVISFISKTPFSVYYFICSLCSVLSYVHKFQNMSNSQISRHHIYLPTGFGGMPIWLDTPCMPIGHRLKKRETCAWTWP